ncbi:MAG: hypothetical protein AABY22_31660 [Nanoarchaeota archaeon]
MTPKQMLKIIDRMTMNELKHELKLAKEENKPIEKRYLENALYVSLLINKINLKTHEKD